MLPTFLVIGAQKSGTTSLLNYLSRHPGIFMAPLLETRFFVAERNWPRGQAWYEELFAEAGDAVARGEKTVAYTMFPRFAGVPERIASVVPEARLVYLVRDPIRRTLSHYRNFALRGDERRPPAEALADPVYTNPSRYAFQLEQYLPHFAREQIHVATTEAMAADPGATLGGIVRFLGLEPAWPDGVLEQRWNVTDPKRAPRGLAREVKRLPGWRRLRRSLPARVKDGIRAVTHARHAPPEIPSPVVRDLEARLRDDVAALREGWLGPEFDGWGLLEPSRNADTAGVD